MPEKKTPPSLEELDAKLRDARAKQDRRKGKTRTPEARDMSGMGLAMRLGLDFVSAVVIGVGIGLLLDWGLGTKPWMLVLFFFLGAIAGTMNVVRTATGMGSAVGYKPATPKKSDDEDD